MALSILDGTQTATTLSTILSSGQHITAHTVVSLGTQAITDMRGAVSGSVVSISNFPATQPISGSVTIGNSVTIGSLPAISGTVTANAGANFAGEIYSGIFNFSENAQMGVYVTDALPAGTNRIGVVTIGAGTVTIGAGTAQIGSVTASISGTVPISISSVTVGNSVTIGSLPSISVYVVEAVQDGNGNTFGNDRDFPVTGTVTIGAGTSQIGSVTASISNTVVTFYPMQGTTVTNSNFTSTTASTSLVSAVAGREVLTVFNEGAGNLHISPGATATTISYQVRLSAGDSWECPQGQLSLGHVAVFATAGTARVTEVT